MEIRQDGNIINTRAPKNALRLDDLQPGDVFRYRRGQKENVYVMGEFGEHFHLNGNSVYHDGGNNPLVILYPEATLELGEGIDIQVEED